MAETTPTNMEAAAAVPARTSGLAPAAAAARAPRAAETGDGAADGGARASGKTQPSYVFLRLKRKRTDDPMECLVVHSEPGRKRAHTTGAAEEACTESGAKPTGTRDLLQAFTKLSTSDKRFVFKHIDTMEQQQVATSSRAKWTERLKRKARSLKDEHAELMTKKSVFQKAPTAVATPTTTLSSKQTESRVRQQQTRSKARRKADVARSRGLEPIPAAPEMEIKEKQTLELHGIRLVDLHSVAKPSDDLEKPDEEDSTVKKDDSEAVTLNGARLRPARVLNPHERELDEAIWQAFRHNDFGAFFRIFNAQRPELRGDPGVFQRPADGGTVLMAAAQHGRSDVIEALLRSSATSVLQQDWEGATAAVFARRSGHTNVETALLACEEAEREKDYVYDVYCVDVSASQEHERSGESATTAEDGSEHGNSGNSVPVVSVSSAVQRWLSQDASAQTEEVEEYMLESDADSNEEVDGMSEDSNDEDHAANDYPDEDSSDDSDSDDSSDLDEIGAPRRGHGTMDDYIQRDDGDY